MFQYITNYQISKQVWNVILPKNITMRCKLKEYFMQVQSINSTYDCRKPCFKSHFKQTGFMGTYEDLYRVAKKGGDFLELATNFAKFHKGHELYIEEIPKEYVQDLLKQNSGCDDQSKILGIINMYTGRKKFVSLADKKGDEGNMLANLMKKLMNDASLQELFEDDENSYLHRLLTGQEFPKQRL